MPKSIGQLINDLAIKAGVKADDAALKDLLSNADIAKVNVPDELATGIESGLHTLDSAAANPILKEKLRSQMKSEILNGVDAELERSYDELGIGDDVKAVLKAETNTGKRAAMLAKKVKELAASANKGKTPEEVQKLTDEINALKTSLGSKQKEFDAQLQDLQSKHLNELTQYEINSLLSQYNYALGDGIPANVKLLTAQGVLQNALQEQGFKIVKKDGRLELLAENGSEAFDKSNNKLTLKSFMDASVSGIIKKSDPAPTGTGNPTFTPSGNGKDAPPANENAVAALDESLKIFQTQ